MTGAHFAEQGDLSESQLMNRVKRAEEATQCQTPPLGLDGQLVPQEARTSREQLLIELWFIEIKSGQIWK